MTSAARALYRINEADANLSDYKRKVYRFRTICAGDPDAVRDGGPSNSLDTGHKGYRANQDTNPSILVSRIEDSRDNSILNLIGGLVFKTLYQFPTVQLEGITAKEQVVNAQYLKQRLGNRIRGGCHAMEQTQIALLDFAMGGTGTIYTPLEGRTPKWIWCDTLDYKFDTSATLPCDVTWGAITRCMPLWFWLKMFPNSKTLLRYRAKGGEGDDAKDDALCELCFYYDMEDEGAYKVFLQSSDTQYDEEPVSEARNPHRIDVFGEDQPFLPFESIFYMALPSVRLPIGLAEKMMPSQIGVWKAIRRIQQQLDAAKSFYKVREDAMGMKTKQEWLRALTGGVAWLKKDAAMDAIQGEPNLPLDPLVGEELQRNSANMNLQAGVNNYSFGGLSAKRPKFSSEVQASVGQGDLMAATVAGANARLWEACVTKFLANGKKWDTNPFMCRIDNIQMIFRKDSPAGTIDKYLRPDADISVSDDTMRFMPKQALIADATQDVQMAAIAAKMGYPNALGSALRRLWEARGVPDVDDRLAQPKPTEMPGQQQLTPQMTGEVQTA